MMAQAWVDAILLELTYRIAKHEDRATGTSAAVIQLCARAVLYPVGPSEAS